MLESRAHFTEFRAGIALGVLLALPGCIENGGQTADPDFDDAGAHAGSGGGGGDSTGAAGDAAGGAANGGTPSPGGPHLEASTTRLSVSTDAAQSVTLTNTGDGVATLTQLVQSGSGAYVPLVQGLDPRRAASALVDPDADGTPGLSPGAAFDLEIRLTPTDTRREIAVLRLLSADEAPVEITLVNFNPDTCLDATPPALDFRVALGDQQTQTLTLQPCLPGQRVTVASARVDGENGNLFRLSPQMPPAPWTIDAPFDLAVEFLPVQIGEVEASLVLVTAPGAPDEEPSIPLRGQTRENQCPQAWPAQASFRVPLDTVVALDGSASVDPDGPDGRPVRYEWVVLERPEGSSGQIGERIPSPDEDPSVGVLDDTRTPNAVFRADMIGTFTLELRVFDEQGLSNIACDAPDARTVTIEVGSTGDVEIRLVYGGGGGGPAEPPEVDLDLHWHHPVSDQWFVAPNDCYYGNPNPDWAQLGFEADDPQLLSDAPGAPETILHSRLENTEEFGAPYRIGVHGYNVPPGVTVPFTVTIRVEGELVWTSPPDLALAADELCEVAALDWPSAAVTPQLECRPLAP